MVLSVSITRVNGSCLGSLVNVAGTALLYTSSYPPVGVVPPTLLVSSRLSSLPSLLPAPPPQGPLAPSLTPPMKHPIDPFVLMCLVPSSVVIYSADLFEHTPCLSIFLSRDCAGMCDMPLSADVSFPWEIFPGLPRLVSHTKTSDDCIVAPFRASSGRDGACLCRIDRFATVLLRCS